MAEQRSHPTANPQSFPSAGTPPNESAIDQATQNAQEYHQSRRDAANTQRVQLRITKRLGSSIVGMQQIGDTVWCSPQQAQLLIDDGAAEYVGAGDNKMYQPTNTQAARAEQTNRMNVGKQPETQAAESGRPTPSTEAKGGLSTDTAKSPEAGKAKP